MALLSSDNCDCPSSLKLLGGSLKELPAGDELQKWQAVTIELDSGSRHLATAADDDCLLCRAPQDEIQTLVDNLEALSAGSQDLVYFEPSEPSFELSFQRTRRGGIQVEAWIDAGNGSTGIYTWDACGTRFYTNEELLVSFIEGIRQEFLSR